MKDKTLTNSAHGAPTRECMNNADKDAANGKPQAGEKTGFDAESRKEAEFECLIRGEYKKEFGERVRKIIERRLKEVKAAKENGKAAPPNDEAKAAADGNEKENKNEGKEKNEKMNNEKRDTVADKDRLIKALIAQNEELKRQSEEQQRKSAARERAVRLREEAQAVKRQYPQFNFEAEIKKEGFVKLLRAGVGMKEAFEVCNMEAILGQRETAAEKKAAEQIRAKGTRPVENGTKADCGVLFGKNVSKLTKKQRAELARRAEKGEKIEL